MATFKVEYLLWRDGRPRWHPGPRLRRAGFKGRDLKDDRGQWLGLEAAIAVAKELNAEVETWRASGERRRRPVAPPAYRTVRQLFEKYWASADFVQKAEKTQRDYRSKGGIFLASRIDDEDQACFGDAPVRAITKPHVFAYWQRMYDERGLHMANGIKAAVSPVFSYAELIGWRDEQTNPWLKLDRPSAPPRLAIWLPQQVNVMLETADADPLMASLGDAFVLGLHSAQSLGDILVMPPRIFAEDRVYLTRMKTKARIDIKATEQVRARVAAIRQRWAAAGIVQHPTIIVNELTGQPYTNNSFNQRFRELRARAAKALPKVREDSAWQGPKIYELAELQFRDLRDTAITRLAIAGNDANHIASVTGHTLASIHTIMKHYLALNRAMADVAIDRVEAWLKREGIKT